MITDAHLGITPGTRVTLLEQSAQEDEPALPEQRATYLGEGLFEIDKADRMEDDYDGLVEVCDPDQFRLEEDKSVTCPSEHPVGRQNPLYEETTATGWFECEVCRLQYRPLPPLHHALDADLQQTCDMDGYFTHGGDGHEIYWHCEEEAAWMVRLAGASGGITEMRLCEDHIEEVMD